MNDEILKILCDLANGLEALAIDIKRRVGELTGVTQAAAVKEETFTILKFEQQTGNRLGEYEVAYEVNNLADKWTHAYNILRQNNATISNRYDGEAYEYGYWLYGENKIYKQKRNQTDKSS
ncbi:MAG: hypothetical protein O2V44_09625 [Candidatus Bathyarchaeota archaeon]|nr:hypothetical protein [Candidatus Bathyarchaeota archaeon]